MCGKGIGARFYGLPSNPLHHHPLAIIYDQGQVYVLIPRVADPSNLQLVGLPPKDLLDAVMAGWAAAGLDAIECLRN